MHFVEMKLREIHAGSRQLSFRDSVVAFLCGDVGAAMDLMDLLALWDQEDKKVLLGEQVFLESLAVLDQLEQLAFMMEIRWDIKELKEKLVNLEDKATRVLGALMENLGREEFLVHLVIKDSEGLQEKQVPRETEGLKVLEEFLASLGPKETRVNQGNLGLLVMQDCRGYLATQVLQGNLANWEIQANRANRGRQERWDPEDPGDFL
ncbi:hypothetical protein MDA_GLEAN10018122 [Myotis davidii]|uniref:Uncharacterized protein n=1 Tax=Myotis davidii TaxID=225400 RepID=L5LHW9_MYODS|nr:hypothetical protein MDA_GLEAN10018122 [Myotis davidii]